MSEALRIALPKGRVFDEACALFSRAGIDVSSVRTDSRRLIHPIRVPGVGPAEILVLRGSDVAVYVEHGVCAVGVAGYDTILEQAPDVFVPLDLRFGACRMVVAGLPGTEPFRLETPRIATKYPRVTERCFLERGAPAQVVELKGAVELAPLVGLADAIVDIVETGETLLQNGLVEHETLFRITSRLIVNKAAFHLRMNEVRHLQLAIASALEAHPG